MGRLYKAYIDSYTMNASAWQDFIEVAGDIYYSPQLQDLARFEQHFKINRLQHIRSVAYLSFLISRKFGLNYKETTRAAMMHDLFYYDWREDNKSHKLHGFRHPYFSLKNAFYHQGELTACEADIIKKHMWPLTPSFPKYKESYVVTAMDKYCATIELYYSFSESYRKKFHKITGIDNEL